MAYRIMRGGETGRVARDAIHSAHDAARREAILGLAGAIRSERDVARGRRRPRNGRP